MTAPVSGDRPDLDELLAALPLPLCTDYAGKGVRHLERNCEVECPEHWESGDDCNRWGRYDGAGVAVLLNTMPDLVAEVRSLREAALQNPIGCFPPVTPGEYAELVALREAVTRVREVHVQTDGGWCRQCYADPWPCPTVAALGDPS